MNSLEPFNNGLDSRRGSRRDRTLVRINDQTDITTAIVDHKVDVSLAKVDGLLQVGSHAAQGVALLRQMRNQLEQTVPGSANDIGYIMDRTVLATGELVTDLAIQLRRIR